MDRRRYSDPVEDGVGRSGRRTARSVERRGRPGGGVRRLVLLGTALILFLLAGAGNASAHAALKGSDPADGSVLDVAPKDITLRFTESVSLLQDSIRVVDPENRAVDTGKPGRAGGRSDTASVTLPTGLDDGTYTIAWRVVSADSHPISGALLFSVGEPSATTAVLPADLTEDPLTSSLYDITRYFAYGALALLIGVAFFLAVVLGGPSEALRRLLPAGWLALLLASAVLLLLRGPYERGTGVGAALDLSVLRETLVSRPGLALLARLALLAAGALLLVRVRRQGNVWGRGALAGGALLSVGLAGTWAAAEHASAGIQVPVAMTSSVLHLLAMAVWLGGLTALLTVLYRAPETLSAAVVNRFSRLAFASVVVLVVTGVYQSWRGLGSWSALTSTAYGEVLVAKLVAVLLLLVAAAFSRRWTGRLGEAPAEVPEPVNADERAQVTERAAVAVATRVSERVGVAGGSSGEVPDGDAVPDGGEVPDGGADVPTGGADAGTPSLDRAGPSAEESPAEDAPRRRLRQSVLAEFTVAVVVLVITTVLTGTLPGRAAAEIAQESANEAAGGVTASSTTIPFDVGTPNGHGKVQIDLGPGRVGKNSVQAVVFGPDGGIATVPELRLTFTLKAQKIGPIDAKITDRGGYWVTDELQLPLPGKWTMRLTVRTTEIDQVTVEKSVRVS
ncbi:MULTISPECIES: copper resistance CopC/CopD family protein [Streptomyces]|uniref:copper resistance CopC/CopD family protein n=1 Tax=Streptomyces scabiei TaxID=1930 RepID=UPI00099CB83C|nr:MULTISPECIES: copper resistance protein CopC [Streptomyces]MBP5892605.1 copper-binding protein [Streptomyces sp. LBUM 1481]MBP5922870.1 copper-binding protein [Streptomyces sp. LBUM 1483]MDX2690830.1 copper resistance protein CopC [Streptomyces scabiei]MDX2755403.1 copper resistance protein CopC [Streptomyces scabiei]MDX2809543.1 copper resistance protein CopC [Streptomyces scabiei]